MHERLITINPNIQKNLGFSNYDDFERKSSTLVIKIRVRKTCHILEQILPMIGRGIPGTISFYSRRV